MELLNSLKCVAGKELMRFHPANSSSYQRDSHRRGRDYRSSSATMAALSCKDSLKLLVVLAFSLFCFYSFIDRYYQLNYLTPAAGNDPQQRKPLPSKLTVKLDDSICDTFTAAVQLQCQEEFAAASRQAEKACEDYYLTRRSCENYCQFLQGNLESCIAVIARPVKKKWSSSP